MVNRSLTFLEDRRGASAVEFAFLSLGFLLALCFSMFMCLIVFFNFQLDYATQKAARQVMLGKVQAQSITQTQFRTNYICTYLPTFMSCNDVIVSLQTVTEAASPSGYYSFVNSGATALKIPVLNNGVQPYSPGSQSSYEYLMVIYPVTFLPRVLANLMGGITLYNGSPAYLLVSTMAFRNESY